jgi:hypothetical protein
VRKLKIFPCFQRCVVRKTRHTTKRVVKKTAVIIVIGMAVQGGTSEIFV